VILGPVQRAIISALPSARPMRYHTLFVERAQIAVQLWSEIWRFMVGISADVMGPTPSENQSTEDYRTVHSSVL
jgi:hypothetical protein